jgi:hypothetical protein
MSALHQWKNKRLAKISNQVWYLSSCQQNETFSLLLYSIYKNGVSWSMKPCRLVRGYQCSRQLVPLHHTAPQTRWPESKVKYKIHTTRTITSSGMLRRVVLVRTDVSEELSASIIRVTRIGAVGTLAVTST